MPTSSPRISIILEESVYEGLRRWAKRDDVSLSLKYEISSKMLWRQKRTERLLTWRKIESRRSIGARP